ncbi:proline-rich transmembrane protein 3 [Coregonus clupeaformis]|uniref:proline-rich transmembrane protein 3 n=1 Tax=Coregonus clupeaformis TaxID=59861 RepID=UPI001E1C3250|nr:proline-rich transmembrane protein 3 [Coregonus clupeaformis]XP_041711767.2 proline-rich transmembrane protein 3 [Coregonus clupeaformis]
MATASLLLLTLTVLLSSLHPSTSQVIVSSSSSLPDPVITPSLKPSLPSSRPRGQSDVPVRVNNRDWPTERAGGGQAGSDLGQGGGEMGTPTTKTRTTDQSQPLSPSQKLKSGSTQSQSTSVEAWTGTMVTAEPSGVSSAKIPTALPPTKSSGAEPLTSGGRTSDGPIIPEDLDDWPATGSGSELVPTVVVKEESLVALTTPDEMPQFRPQAQTEFSGGPSSKMAEAQTTPTVSLTVQPRLSGLTTSNRIVSTQSSDIRVTAVPVVTQPTFIGGVVTGNMTDNATTPTDGPIAGQTPTVTSPSLRPITPGSINEQPKSVAPQGTIPSSTNQQPSTTTQGATTTTTTNKTATKAEPRSTSSSTTNQPKKATEPERTTTSTTKQSTKTGTTPLLITPTLQIFQGRYVPKNDSRPAQRNHSIPMGRPHLPPSSTPATPSPPPSSFPSPNGTSLLWDDLSRTLAFAWELHVYGSAGLFLLLLAGAALGLALSPSMHCPHRGALTLANALLLIVGAARAALFMIDPYGTRKILPRPAVTALYNLALPLLVWAQAALALLAMKGTGVSLLPSALERPPLVAVLAVLQCTLLLAADLLSPALSPAVPVTLQSLSLCWGLALCLGYLCYVFPRLRHPTAQPPVPEEGRAVKAWPGGRRTGLVLGRVLAVCALLGVLCCGLHVHATLWLYGLLGDWRRFCWGWWLVHFWARLLELAWAFSLLLLGSWVFWRPRGARGRGDGVAGEGRLGGDLPSPGQSSGSTHKHTCWAKIVQSLTGKPCGKSESNGVGGSVGGGGGAGELPNNWAGQERSGADISKSLIRNQNREAPPSQPRCVKDSNRGRNQRGMSAERGMSDGSTGSLLRLQPLGQPLQHSLSGSVEQEKESGVSLYDFDLRPPSPIDLGRSIDEALHREHLLHGGSLFQPLCAPSPTPSPGSAVSQGGPWLRRNSDPQISDSSEDRSARTESSVPLGGSVLSSVPSRQVTAPPTPSHQGHRWAGDGGGSVPSSVSCPVSLRPSRTSTVHLLRDDGGDDTRPFLTPDSETQSGRAGREGAGGKSYLEVSRQDDSASVSSEIIDL